MTTPTPERSVEEIVRDTFPENSLHYVSYDNNLDDVTIDGHFDLQILIDELNALLQAERQKQEEVVEAERERIVAILKASYLMTNGYKDTDTVRTAMYIENEGFNIAINKRLDFFIEQITQPNNSK